MGLPCFVYVYLACNYKHLNCGLAVRLCYIMQCIINANIYSRSVVDRPWHAVINRSSNYVITPGAANGVDRLAFAATVKCDGAVANGVDRLAFATLRQNIHVIYSHIQ